MASLNIHRMLPLATYAILALAIVGPWLQPGYIFALDMVFTPHLRMPDTLTSSYMFHAVLHVLNFVAPSSVIQKLLLLCVFFLSGVGMHRLVQIVSPHRMGAYFGGVLYAVNPFTYDRLMTGQYSVLLGYALLPFFVRSLLVFLQKPQFRQGVIIAIWVTVISVVSVHTLGSIVIISIVAAALWLAKNRRNKPWKGLFWKWSVVSIGAFLLLNCYWFLPLLAGKGSTAKQIASFTSGDTASFATIGGSFAGKLLQVLSLRGFWAEDRDIYLQPSQQIGTWGLLLLLIWLLVVIGLISLWHQRQRAITAFFAIIVLAGCILAVGYGWMQHVPILAGFREPQKFAGLIALGFAVLGSEGIANVMRFIKNEFDSTVGMIAAGSLALLLPIIVTSTIFWGARSQLAARSYPAAWTTVNAQLNADNEHFNTLFLPWHLYMRFGFADRVITSPAPQFFDKPVIVSDQPELGDVAAVHPTQTTQQLDRLLQHADSISNFASQLANLHIKYIILDKEEDYQKYNYLQHMSGLRQVAHHDTLTVYLNEQFGGKDETR